jgi:hypothetical protein
MALRSAAWVLCHLQFCAHDQPEKDDSEKRKQQPGKYGWDAPNKEQPNVGGTGGWKRRTQPELIAQHSDCDIIKPRFNSSQTFGTSDIYGEMSWP